MQFFMRVQQADIITIEQPVNLLAGQGQQVIGQTWPLEFLLCQRLVIEYKAIVFPHQTFDFIALAVGKGIQRPGKGIMPQFLLNQRRQPVDLLAKINGGTIKINLRHRQRRA